MDGIYNSQNDRTCVEADIKGNIRQIRKFHQKLMVWLGVCPKELLSLVIFENGILDHSR